MMPFHYFLLTNQTLWISEKQKLIFEKDNRMFHMREDILVYMEKNKMSYMDLSRKLDIGFIVTADDILGENEQILTKIHNKII